VAAIAGIGISGYKVKAISGTSNGGTAQFECGNLPPDFNFNLNLSLNPTNTPGTYLFLVGSQGVGTLAPNMSNQPPASCFTANGTVVTLHNVTVKKNSYEGTAVAVFTATVQSASSCVFSIYGTSINKAESDGSVGMWANAYFLTSTDQ